MSELTKIASQLKSAAKSLLDEIAGIDKQVELLHNKRHAITSGQVSKADYLFYVKEHFKIKGDQFKKDLIKNIEKNTRHDFGSLERQHEMKDSFIAISFLTERLLPVEITENALYYYFGDIFIDRIKDALDDKNWPNDCMPIDERRKELVSIEALVADLMKKRNEIVSSLDAAGLAR